MKTIVKVGSAMVILIIVISMYTVVAEEEEGVQQKLLRFRIIVEAANSFGGSSILPPPVKMTEREEVITALREVFDATVEDGSGDLRIENEFLYTEAPLKFRLHMTVRDFIVRPKGIIELKDGIKLINGTHMVSKFEGYASILGHESNGEIILNSLFDGERVISGENLALSPTTTLNQGKVKLKDGQVYLMANEEVEINNVIVESQSDIGVKFADRRPRPLIPLVSDPEHFIEIGSHHIRAKSTKGDIVIVPQQDSQIVTLNQDKYRLRDTKSFEAKDSLEVVVHEGGSIDLGAGYDGVSRMSVLTAGDDDNPKVTVKNSGKEIQFFKKGGVRTKPPSGSGAVPMVIRRYDYDERAIFDEYGRVSFTDAKTIYQDGTYNCG